MKFYCEEESKVLDEVRSTKEGLSSDDAAKRLEFEQAAYIRDRIKELRK